jgi:hypothetical protein
VGIQAGYSPEEWLRIQDILLGGAAQAPQNLRSRVDLLFGHYYLLWGENGRKMELPDLALLDYPSSEGPTPCGCLVSLLRDGKLNKTARKEFMGALRHKEPLFFIKGRGLLLPFKGTKFHQIALQATSGHRSHHIYIYGNLLIYQVCVRFSKIPPFPSSSYQYTISSISRRLYNINNIH